MEKEHQFGGDWTSQKLERIRKYLVAYTTIFAKNPRAQKLTRIYVDAFAGTGYRSKPPRLDNQTTLFQELAEPEADKFLKGSALIALEVEPSFHQYIFIERDKQRANELSNLKQQFPQKASAIQIVQQDANSYLKEWCRNTDWRRCRAVILLDPYGMEVEWELIEVIARTQAVDLWVLFPLGVAVNRLLTRNEPPPGAWADALTRIFGTQQWKDAFYPSQMDSTLFGVEKVRLKEADFDKVGSFFVQRLKTIFLAVADNPLPLRNSRNVPLYLLCFAAGNPKGASTALKIAKHILSK
ncbi:MAG: three-Cys-motif partner protein TcmP [Cyclobacteriaceae bacterium]|nr:three-Cys-motif partner protein TcmP [Cyclobacteriaceae bacterium]